MNNDKVQRCGINEYNDTVGIIYYTGSHFDYSVLNELDYRGFHIISVDKTDEGFAISIVQHHSVQDSNKWLNTFITALTDLTNLYRHDSISDEKLANTLDDVMTLTFGQQNLDKGKKIIEELLKKHGETPNFI